MNTSVVRVGGWRLPAPLKKSLSSAAKAATKFLKIGGGCAL
jgi:hypothetical protein